MNIFLETSWSRFDCSEIKKDKNNSKLYGCKKISGQLPDHWHLDSFVDYSAPFQIVRALFLSDPDLKIKTAKWFLEEIMNNDDFPVSDKGFNMCKTSF